MLTQFICFILVILIESEDKQSNKYVWVLMERRPLESCKHYQRWKKVRVVIFLT